MKSPAQAAALALRLPSPPPRPASPPRQAQSHDPISTHRYQIRLQSAAPPRVKLIEDAAAKHVEAESKEFKSQTAPEQLPKIATGVIKFFKAPALEQVRRGFRQHSNKTGTRLETTGPAGLLPLSKVRRARRRRTSSRRSAR